MVCGMSQVLLERAHAEELDAADPLAGFRERFALDDPSLIYLNGNSLGVLPLATLPGRGRGKGRKRARGGAQGARTGGGAGTGIVRSEKALLFPFDGGGGLAGDVED